MTIIAKDIGIVMDEARLNAFPLPLCAVAEQVFTSALGAGMHKEDDGRIVKVWERFGGRPLLEEGTVEEEIANANELEVQSTGKIGKVLFVGLGVMGVPMGLAIQKAGIEVVGYDFDSKASERFSQAGGKAASDLLEGAEGAEVVMIMTNTAFQAEAVLFGDDEKSGIASSMCFSAPRADSRSPAARKHHHRLLNHRSYICHSHTNPS